MRFLPCAQMDCGRARRLRLLHNPFRPGAAGLATIGDFHKVGGWHGPFAFQHHRLATSGANRNRRRSLARSILTSHNSLSPAPTLTFDLSFLLLTAHKFGRIVCAELTK